jgi:hypothetical protein
LLGGIEQRVDGVASVVGVGGVGEECVAGTGDGVEECGDFDGAGGLAV